MNADRAILLTPPGVSAIAVVRVTGPGVAQLLQKHFSKPLRRSIAVYGKLVDETGIEIDDPVIVLSPEGQHADVNLHGGAWVVRAFLNLADRAGFEVVERPKLPLPDDAIDVTNTTEREIAAYLPLATTELALRTLLAQEGAWLDFESRHDAITNDEINRILNDRSLHWLLHPPRVAIVGAANVGKSTLANRLFAQERSITADIPGTTRDWVGEMANLDGLAVKLVDTPGIRETTDEIEREAIKRSDTQIQRADLVVQVLDATRPLEPEQSPLLARFPDALRVANKSDGTPLWDAASIDAVHTVGTTGLGVDELMRRIRAHFGCDRIDPSIVRCWTERQRALIRATLPVSFNHT